MPGEFGRGERLAARRGQAVQPGPVMPDERQADQLAGLDGPGVRLADPLAVGGRGRDELVGRLQRPGQRCEGRPPRAGQVQVPGDRGVLREPAERVELGSERRVAEFQQRDQPGQVRLEQQLGFAGRGGCDRELARDAQPFGRSAWLPAHVAQREQRIRQRAAALAVWVPSARAPSTAAAPRAAARGRSRSGPSASSRARAAVSSHRISACRGAERRERLLEQRDHVRTRRFGHRGHAVQAERGACQHRGVAGSAGSPGGGEERGPCVLTVSRPALRVTVFAQHPEAGGRKAAGDLDGTAKMTGGLVEGQSGRSPPGPPRSIAASAWPRSPSGSAIVRW